MWVNIFELGTGYRTWGQRSSDNWFWAGGTPFAINSAADAVMVDDCDPVFSYQASDHAVIRTQFPSTAGVNILYLEIPGWGVGSNNFRIRCESDATDSANFDLCQMAIDGTDTPVIGTIINNFMTPSAPLEIAVSGNDGNDGIAIKVTESQANQPANFFVEQWVDSPEEVSYNCECDDEYPRKTLAEMRKYVLTRLGMYTPTLLPGTKDLIDAFIVDAQEQLSEAYKVFRMERFFTWNLVPGVRFYDLDANADTCTKKLDPRMLTWVGISQQDNFWRPLVCGIRPEFYYSNIESWPTHYEIRQCIELWPAPSDENWKLRIKGYFGLMPLVDDEDYSTIDYQAIQLFALANAKAHYQQPDAANIMAQANAYIKSLVAGQHQTRRYIPGVDLYVPPPLPVLTGYPGDP